MAEQDLGAENLGSAKNRLREEGTLLEPCLKELRSEHIISMFDDALKNVLNTLKPLCEGAAMRQPAIEDLRDPVTRSCISRSAVAAPTWVCHDMQWETQMVIS